MYFEAQQNVRTTLFREQRVTALVAHLFIGLAVFLTPVLKVETISKELYLQYNFQ